MAGEVTSKPVTLIRPTKGWIPIDVRELWENRELLYFLVWRNLKVRYKQTILGVAWSILQPALAMLVFTFLFGQLAGVPCGATPYPICVYTALLPWNLFAVSLTSASISLVANENIITKVYFPRVLLPLAAVLTGFVDFAIAFSVLIALMVYFGVVPTISIAFLPLFVSLVLVCATGISLWLSALDAKYRDVRHTLPFLAQLWFFATPVVYSLSLIPKGLHWFYSLNPMVGVTEGFKWSLLGEAFVFEPSIGLSLVIGVAIFLGGIFYFRRAERTLADVV